MFTASAFKLALSAIGVVSAAVAEPAGAAAQQQTMPDRTWLGVKRVLLLTHVEGGRGADAALTGEVLCARVQAIASAGSPLPISCTRLGDPQLEDPSAAVLVTQAAFSDAAAPKQLLLFTIRRQTIGGLEPTPGYFGAAPQAVPFSGTLSPAELDGPLRSSLAQVLPWLSGSPVILQPDRRGE